MTDELAQALLLEVRRLAGAVERLEERLPALTGKQRMARLRERRKAEKRDAQAAVAVTHTPEDSVTHKTNEALRTSAPSPPFSSSPLSAPILSPPLSSSPSEKASPADKPPTGQVLALVSAERRTPRAKKPVPTEEQAACRKAIRDRIEALYLSRTGSQFDWGAAGGKENSCAANFANRCKNELGLALGLIDEAQRRGEAGDRLFSDCVLPSMLMNQFNQLRVPRTERPNGQRKGYTPWTGTKERFENYDDGDPLGLNLKGATRG